MLDIKQIKIDKLIKLAKQNNVLSGKERLSTFDRLKDCLVDSSGELAWQIDFYFDQYNLLIAKFNLQTNLNVICQRCLMEMKIDVDKEIYLAPCINEQIDKKVPEIYEALTINDDCFPALSIIEDELLLSLPLVAKHKNENCNAILTTLNEQKVTENLKNNPFAQLVKSTLISTDTV